jgi:hypothetical protein
VSENDNSAKIYTRNASGGFDHTVTLSEVRPSLSHRHLGDLSAKRQSTD